MKPSNTPANKLRNKQVKTGATLLTSDKTLFLLKEKKKKKAEEKEPKKRRRRTGKDIMTEVLQVGVVKSRRQSWTLKSEAVESKNMGIKASEWDVVLKL